MADLEVLNRHFVVGPEARFGKLADGVVVAEIDNSLATATISLYGRYVVSWRPKHQNKLVIWVSKLAQFKPGKVIRGGVPICWPWFCAHSSNAKLPAHGCARISPWDVVSVGALDNGAGESLWRCPTLIGAAIQGHGQCASRLESRLALRWKWR
jgi:glucose-6-phosphate 1-epimerase